MKRSPPARPSCYRLIGSVFLAAMATGLPTAAAQSPAEWNSQFAELENNLRQSSSLSAGRRHHVSPRGADSGRRIAIRPTSSCVARRPCSTTCASCYHHSRCSRWPRNWLELQNTQARTSTRRTVRRGASCLTTPAGCVGRSPSPIRCSTSSEIVFIKRHRASVRPHVRSVLRHGGHAGRRALRPVQCVRTGAAGARRAGNTPWWPHPPDLPGSRCAAVSRGPVTMSFDGMGNRQGTEGQGGTFLSPDLSYDGQRILFAYVENTGDMLHRHHVDPRQGPLGGRTLLPRLQRQRRRLRSAAADRRHLERLRSLLAAQRTDRVHQRTARWLSALRPRLPELHAVRHGGRWQRHHLPELPRDQRMASERDE